MKYCKHNRKVAHLIFFKN